MKIIKFGGSSVATPETIRKVFSIIQEKNKQQDVAVVFSAFGGVTESLLTIARLAREGDQVYRDLLQTMEEKHLDMVRQLIAVQNQSTVMTYVKVRFNELEDLFHGIYLIKENSDRTLDYVASFGERLSTFILAEALAAKGIKTQFLDAREVIRTNDRFGQARVDFEVTNHLIKEYFLKHDGIKIITGFIASTAKGETTTLGRSGSDYTAAIFAAALDAEDLEIWTDVSGVLTSDPKLVYTAFSIPQLSYNEAMELSHFGAKVIFPATMQPAMKKNIPIYIKNTFEPSNKGTLINGEVTQGGLIKGISSMSSISIVNVQGASLLDGITGSRVFKALAEAKVNIVLISQASSEHSICLAIKTAEAYLAKEVVEREFYYEIKSGEMDEVTLMHGFSTVAVVGENMKQNPGASGRMFRALGRNNINVAAIAQGSSELNISAVIPQADLQKALNALHEAFFLSENKVLHVFLVGVGLIGKALIKMIATQQEKLKGDNELDIQIHGMANSRYMAFHEDGFDLKNPHELSDQDQKMDLEEFIRTMEEMNFSNSVFVDCTASQSVADAYARVLGAKVAIVTPNKKANSSSMEQYKELKKLAKKRGVKFLYETNVAAGLPVINTLQDLMLSGDKVIRIEAVLSGSMNFIFSELEKGDPFSQVVRIAKDKGYTEPDPRDDLSGMDVARKILILGREAEQTLEFEDITIQSMVPEDCREAATVEEFFQKLQAHDSEFEKLLKEAESKGEKLRFMATLENGKAKVGLNSLPNAHPFSSLSGSDNMILLTTERYLDRPMIIRGPGAGADVTAAGVFADVIRIGNYTRE
ncbi:MAG TPA: bifunctional aspartate kinase/homoserine dehydrogenase I [Algoriphagus sp.]|jgi:aspartokinase/homoserine dehydrogenase 1|uniref:bifunctional aspartate kinase/homoserine dehydrogenase I n=2 Tax=Algoriphagus TaxID=246875 RepID=UPI000C35B4A5|nr:MULTISPECIES: bifunctional aspartate kinase/homoserine dehydrogenase I [unclassified Algoriphagus]MAL13112.1 bifunctional aspartate kinase/homoserine dehydrogenase I [Algoriphagus sp.]QYH41051.1 bifunctional aspartate kinase/homoserine dehydrogenase I [Algoriphagus sp. NBT04N3]HAD51384.1 bifunctional aspartate kinase/homoserine dehydrogenase I [Algoriphagus sp.]HCD86375.1 bifunctional aspartate kinase/homoserine dehydrogenase I [Algoriphagus sp.]HCH45860.1 bifunctional aspartate kinase/homo|tara:strand:+ start:11517 stop:13964 length:2448 start_codon:yes stop_codon:yes gene_type:complete